jgi:hypothetical protein
MVKKDFDGSWKNTYYDESEWRIIYSEDMRNFLRKIGESEVAKKFIKPSELKKKQFEEFGKILKKSEKRPEFLIPVRPEIAIREKFPISSDIKSSTWFSILIYPSIRCKVESENDKEIRGLINKLKPNKPENIILKEMPAPNEFFSKPIETDLDACRNF